MRFRKRLGIHWNESTGGDFLGLLQSKFFLLVQMWNIISLMHINKAIFLEK